MTLLIRDLTIVWQNEPPHDKTNKMTCAPSVNSDQPGHPLSLITVFAVRMKKHWVLSYPMSVQRRLIRLGGCPDCTEFMLGAQVIVLVLSWGDSNVSFGFISASVESINRTEAGTTDHYGLTAAVGSVTSNIKLRANQQEFLDGVGAYSLVTIGQENRDGNNWVTYTGILVYPPFCKQSVYPSCFWDKVHVAYCSIPKWAASWQNQQNGMCAQRRLTAWASAQSDQSSLSHEES